MATINWKSEADIFNDAKQRKKDELSQKCNQSIISGFTSSALGVSHTYPSDEEAQRNFNSEINKFLIDSTYTISEFKTIDSGYLAHTKDQLFQVFSDGHSFKINQLSRLNTLKSQVDAINYSTDPTTQATNESNLNAITW